MAALKSDKAEMSSICSHQRPNIYLVTYLEREFRAYRNIVFPPILNDCNKKNVVTTLHSIESEIEKQ